MKIKVVVEAPDPISAAGITSELGRRAEFDVSEPHSGLDPDVWVLVVDCVDADALACVRSASQQGRRRVVVVVTRLDDSGLLSAVEAGACALLRRFEATPERLGEAVSTAARGDGSVPPDLLGQLLGQFSSVQRQVLGPRGLSLNGFADREIEVLRLLSQGSDTAEIAQKLAYSERTVKNIIHGVMARNRLRNRVHAVAHAVRAGVI